MEHESDSHTNSYQNADSNLKKNLQKKKRLEGLEILKKKKNWEYTNNYIVENKIPEKCTKVLRILAVTWTIPTLTTGRKTQWIIIIK